MAVVNDYQCKAHGTFESMTGQCPHGCSKSMVELVHLQAPGLKSGRTKNIDKTLGNLASDFGMTDMNNQNGTSAVKRPDPYAVEKQNQLMGKLGDTTDRWGQVQPGGVFKQGVGAVPVEGRSGQGAIQTIQSVGAKPGDALEAVRPALNQPKPLVVGRHDAKIEV
jgi:hypothetical protein